MTALLDNGSEPEKKPEQEIRQHEVAQEEVRQLLQNEEYLRRGLTTSGVEKRRRQGRVNEQRRSYSRSYWRIVRGKLFTIFNLMNAVLAGVIIFAALLDFEQLKNLSFLGVVLANLVVGIFQEIRAKRTIDKLSLLHEPQVLVIREGRRHNIPVEEIVVDDLIFYRDGNQITVDGEFLWGDGFEVDEALLTGESDPVAKKAGDKVSSGSYVVAGEGYCHVSYVGEDTYAAKISSEVSRRKKQRSILMQSLEQLLKWIAVAIIPIAALLFLSKFLIQPGELAIIMVSTVSAIIGMIPQGLILLTSVAFANSAMKLGRMHALVQNLPAIEMLARVDVLCLDKTGTITSGELEMIDLVPLPQDNDKKDWQTESDAREAVAHMLAAQPAGNNTQLALAAAIEPRISKHWQVTGRIHFRSQRKWSAVSFEEQGTFYLGAAERLIHDKSRYNDLLDEEVSRRTADGLRVVLLAHSPDSLPDTDEGSPQVPDSLKPLALLVLADRIRADAAETFRYFREQGVSVRVISGDNPRTVSAIAQRVGIEGAERRIDMTGIGPDADYRQLAAEYRVFGRVDPEQKRALIKGLKDEGHIVGMTGDGINDVPALKDADCGIALAAGSDAARSAADIVLLKDNLTQMVDAVYEGRRVVNNIERVSSIYLTKTVYSMILAIAFIFIQVPYPILPLQMSLIATTGIGMPTFFLALRPNKQRMEDGFMERVLLRSVPVGIIAAFLIIVGTLVSALAGLEYESISSVAYVVLAFITSLVLMRACRPFNTPRRILWIASAVMLVLPILILPGFFDIVPPYQLARLALIYGPLTGLGFFLLYLTNKGRPARRIASFVSRLVARGVDGA